MLYGLVVCFINASGQSFNFSKLNTYNGLSHNQINAIIRDADGFVWFGTLAGLNRYDGYTCKIFRKRPGNPHSLPDNNIRQLFELPHGKMWVVTMAGACIYNAETERFESDVFSYLK
ncbi:MAG TPA: two-component regulator propeller domain-containing protein, partial [Phnomibacter sp.]|nr:two-component regulator propeller domain-containing protein [Phnomibacter sp.]